MTYRLYWGKAKPGAKGPSCHLLSWHSLDVAAVGWHLLAPEKPLTQILSARLGMSPGQLRRFFVFLLGLHDLGKFSRTFQSLARPEGVELAAPLERYEYTVRHDRLGMLLWRKCWLDWLDEGVLRWPEVALDRGQRQRRRNAIKALMNPFFGHHGQPVEADQLRLEVFFGSDEHVSDVESAKFFVAEWADLIDIDWPVEQLLSEEWLASFLSLSWTISGWATLSDWLGSNQEHFHYCQDRISLTEYWQRCALPRAEAALREAGFFQPLTPLPYNGLGAWFDDPEVVPTPLQKEAESLPIPSGPQLFILEDVTGAGKTEAACILAQRLLAAGHAEGLYFALPTMATSNAMYERLGSLHRRFYTPDSNPSFVLAHGASRLNESFSTAIDNAQPFDLDYGPGEASATAQCNRWLADSRKKALLAEVGVGTIDQALMGVLPFRHQSLRLFGLTRKILIVDEVHAYDHYMQTLLGRLLSHHARQGGSAILLTATLPQAMRQALVAAWQAGLDLPPGSLECRDFPLLTQISGAAVREVSLESRPEVSREVGVEWLAEEQQAIDIIMQAVEAGECIAWVRNTVDDAIRAYEAIRESHPQPERCLLFHSRFAMLDRQRIESDVLRRLGKTSASDVRKGQVIVSTQVFQESLDCDADLMISDLAPVDLLIQRAGRLQRHQRGPRRPPLLRVLAPEWSEDPDAQWLKRALPGTQAVYRDTPLLWLTQRVLRRLKAIRMPEEARELIESVYGAVVDEVPDGLHEARFEQRGLQKIAGSRAFYSALELEAGYVWDRHKWQEEQEIGTRLIDEPTVNVALLKRDAAGALVLWAEGERHAEVLSQIKLRQSQARKLAELPARYLDQWEVLQEGYKALRFVQPWLAEEDAEVTYDKALGCLFGRAAEA